ncbi:MAG: hypothetical protein QW820_06735 [Sulfolobales archaeon]
MSEMKCITATDCAVEVREDRIIIMTWAWTLEIEVEKVKDVKVVKGDANVVREGTCLSTWF